MKNDFEHQVNKLIEILNKKDDIIGWKNEPRRDHSGKYLKSGGEKFDYIIFSKKNILCFDCKMTSTDKWKVVEKDIRQANNLIKIHNLGYFDIKCFFLIYFFTEKKYYYIDILNFVKVIETRKYISKYDCEIIKLEDLIL
ncbi:MAG: Holliday junction resolvase RecU [Promethearchaeota archaeon]